jgi:ABC-2 type transport system ATP-binding protein
MQEVEAICDRIIIIKNGIIVADNKTSEISQNLKKQEFISVEFNEEVSLEKLTKISGVIDVKVIAQSNYLIEYSSTADIRVAISKFAQKEDLLILEMQREKEKLEEIFKQLTK